VTVPLSPVPTGRTVTGGRSPVTDEGGVVTVTELGRPGWLGPVGAAGTVGTVAPGSVVGVDGAGTVTVTVTGTGTGVLTGGETVTVPNAGAELADALTAVAAFPAGVVPTPEADVDAAGPADGVATVVGTAPPLEVAGGAAMPISGQACALP
jgi:hypothetical protein